VRILTVLGTRPEVIKLAPVVAELRRDPEIDTVVVATGQHREMLDQALAQFELEADIDLGVMRPEQRLHDLTADLVRALGDTVAAQRPDYVLVQGDTSTTLCGALVAFYENVAVAHVEAGLRSGDDRAPFPEETNRRLVARLATLHFCPTARNAANLTQEAVPEARVFVTGNTGIDALHWAVERARRLTASVECTRPRSILLTVHRRENHGEALRRVCMAVRTLVRRGDVGVVFPMHPSPAVRDVVLPELSGIDGVQLCEPLDYLSLVHVLDACDVVLTDSGGLQEEGPALGKPVLVLRDTTERPEAVEAGVARLVGTNPLAIISATSALLDDLVAYEAMAHPESPYGDGRARFRIVDILREQRGLRRAA
jgi:UDP-N-acetylglucosamine 2-epimerase (non-hydrolysing)